MTSLFIHSLNRASSFHRVMLTNQNTKGHNSVKSMTHKILRTYTKGLAVQFMMQKYQE